MPSTQQLKHSSSESLTALSSSLTGRSSSRTAPQQLTHSTQHRVQSVQLWKKASNILISSEITAGLKACSSSSPTCHASVNLTHRECEPSLRLVLLCTADTSGARGKGGRGGHHSRRCSHAPSSPSSAKHLSPAVSGVRAAVGQQR